MTQPISPVSATVPPVPSLAEDREADTARGDTGSTMPQNMPVGTPGRRSSLRLLKLLIGIPLIALIWWFVVRHVRGDLNELRKQGWSTLHIRWTSLAVAFFFLLCARLTNALNCRHVLAAMGQHATARQVIPIIWVASLGRYVPGKVHVVAGATMMLVRIGVEMTAALAALFLSTALMILISLITALPLLFVPAVRRHFPHGPVIALLGLAMAAIVLQPGVFPRLCNVVLRKLKRPALPQRLQLAPYLRAICQTVLRIAFLGLALFFAATSLHPLQPRHYLLAVGSAGLASFVGFLAVFSPAGLGVHESIYILTFQTIIDPLSGLLAILFRLLNLLADAVTGLVGMVMLKDIVGPK
ncbi:MAG: YbhN family protein [Tepidisphaeraceae bacterium]|jgi:hypothetical protein